MSSQESSRSWPEAMKGSADVVFRGRASGDEEVIVGTQANGWDPGEVWLSRIKRPRDRAAIALAAGISNPALQSSE